MIPRALRSPLFAMARPPRPPTERRAVRDAAETVRAETGLTAVDPIASIIAARVVEAMKDYLAEDMDPLLVAVGEMGAVTVNVAVPATARSTLALMFPLPDAGQLEPAVAEHVQVAPVMAAGRLSATVAAVITDGPALAAMMLYVTL